MIHCWSLYVLYFAFLNIWISEQNFWCPIKHSSERHFRDVISYIVSSSQSFSYSDDIIKYSTRNTGSTCFFFSSSQEVFCLNTAWQPVYSITSIFLVSFDTDPFLSWKNRLSPSFILHRQEISVYCISIFGFHHQISFFTTILGKFHGSIHHAQQYVLGWVYIF